MLESGQRLLRRSTMYETRRFVSRQEQRRLNDQARRQPSYAPVIKVHFSDLADDSDDDGGEAA
jgi:hypothetical protein